MKSKNACISPRMFALWLGCVTFSQILAGSYMKSILTTLERRFQLSSTILAALAVAPQVGNMTLLLFVSYFGHRYNRPRIIAIGCSLMLLGYAFIVSPQFFGDRYQFDDISKNTSSHGKQQNPVTCYERYVRGRMGQIFWGTMGQCGLYIIFLYGIFLTKSTETSLVTEDCEVTESKGTSNLYLLLIVGTITVGIGSTPVQPLGYSYVDDHANEHNAAVYLGIVNSIALVGPVLGYVLGSFFLKVWVDVGWIDTSAVNIEPRHPAWVGAWWIGFIVVIGCMLFSFLPLWFFPKEMEKEEDMLKKEENNHNYVSDDQDQSKDDFKNKKKRNPVTKELSGMIASIKRLFSNGQIVLIVGCKICSSFKIAGVATFVIKYLEVGFGKSAATGSFLIGAINLPFLVMGTILGSVAIKIWKLNKIGTVRLVAVAYFVSGLSLSSMIFIGCDSIDVAGFTVPYSESEVIQGSAVSSCNSACHCDENVYTPVCGPDGVTYISPCFAGCTGFDVDQIDGFIKNYTHCSCVTAEAVNQDVVTVGRCVVSKCEDAVWWVIGIKSISNFCMGLSITPLLSLLLRTMDKRDKSFGLGLSFFLYRLLGWIPSPIIFGYIIDRTCLLWNKAKCSDRSYCRLYDNVGYRVGFGGLLLAVNIVAFCLTLALYRLVVREEKAKELTKDEKIKMSSSELQKLVNVTNEDALVGKETVI